MPPSFRSDELKNLKGMKYLDALCVYFWATTPVLISILTFCTYVLLGNTLTAAKVTQTITYIWSLFCTILTPTYFANICSGFQVFTSIALFNMLIFPLNVFPWVINGLIEAWVSLKRVNRFLILEELDWQKFYSPENDKDSGAMVEITNGYFTWKTKTSDSGQDSVENDGSFSNDSLKNEKSLKNGVEKDNLENNCHVQGLEEIDLSVFKVQLVFCF